MTFHILVQCEKCKICRQQTMDFSGETKGFILQPCTSRGMYGAIYCDGQMKILSIK